ncbi:single-stranded DNA-binding protein [Gloeobacter kilaueensis]|uniref:Single-strand binding protein n=1 Tax=Gloeobacter kilaueensis (strain ATCC BAA-2537 / CCAP 1431/1 / ULC 316 / JS1) TaxID=1183438 RepID=U5QI96_GLOK1|nr:single-stranded DNA-binding protein [Gloeobacter kilaueensis]AGY58618.1 single-strand binding protein [Gloeobacter kilaueensis JS1]
MNTIALQGKLHSAPELRHTQDGLAQASALLSFAALKTDEADYTLRLVLFGNAAEEFCANFHQGDALIVEGRLQSEARPRPDGTKERVIELIARRCHALTPASTRPATAAPVPAPAQKTAAPSASRPTAARRPGNAPARPAVAVADDDIPF